MNNAVDAVAQSLARTELEEINFGNVELPVYLCLDASGSMQGMRIKSLNDGVRDFIRSASANEDAQETISLCIIVFNGDGARVIQERQKISSISISGLEEIEAKGETPLGDAVMLALDEIEKFNSMNRKAYKPYLVVMSDGEVSSYKDNMGNAIQRAIRMQRNGELRVRCVGIGSGCDFGELQKLQIHGKIASCNEMNIRVFFDWLSSKSIELSTQSLMEPDDDMWGTFLGV